jgi:hypothetical protein
LTVNVGLTGPVSVINTANVSGGGEVNAANNAAADSTNIVIPPPTNLSATATSTSEIVLSWDAFDGADSYQVERSFNNAPFTVLETDFVNASEDTAVSAGTTYVYRVRIVISGSAGAPSNVDIATTIVFAEALVPHITTIKASHITELRTAVNAVRAAAGLPPATFTDASPAGVFIKAVHITELRSFLDAARAMIGVPAMAYTDSSLTGQHIKAAHIDDLRTGVK